MMRRKTVLRCGTCVTPTRNLGGAEGCCERLEQRLLCPDPIDEEDPVLGFLGQCDGVDIVLDQGSISRPTLAIVDGL
jgi:hypothetical protein